MAYFEKKCLNLQRETDNFRNMTAKMTTQLKPKARGGKPLMSELLTQTRKYIEQAEQADVESLHQFLFNKPERPLIAMGHGGSHSSAAYAALLSMFTSVFGDQYRGSNPNDPNNLGGIDKRYFRDGVNFKSDFKR